MEREDDMYSDDDRNDLTDINSLNLELDSIRISEFPSQPLLVLSSEDTVGQAVQFLRKNQISSAPVRDHSAALDAHWTEEYLGIVDTVHVAQFLLKELRELHRDISVNRGLRFKSFCDSKVATVTQKTAKYAPLMVFDATTHTLLDVVLVFGKHKVHRMPVVDSLSGKLCNFVTQNAVFREILKLVDEVPSFFGLTLSSLGVEGTKMSSSVLMTQPLLDALTLVAEESFHAAPVVDEAGAVVGIVSAFDIYHVASSEDLFTRVAGIQSGDESIEQGGLDVGAFLAWRHAAETTGVTTPDPTVADTKKALTSRPLISVSMSDTLEHVMKVMVDAHIHHVLVRNDQGAGGSSSGSSTTTSTTTGAMTNAIITSSDILDTLAVEPTGYFGDFFQVNTAEYIS